MTKHLHCSITVDNLAVSVNCSLKTLLLCWKIIFNKLYMNSGEITYLLRKYNDILKESPR